MNKPSPHPALLNSIPRIICGASSRSVQAPSISRALAQILEAPDLLLAKSHDPLKSVWGFTSPSTRCVNIWLKSKQLSFTTALSSPCNLQISAWNKTLRLVWSFLVSPCCSIQLCESQSPCNLWAASCWLEHTHFYPDSSSPSDKNPLWGWRTPRNHLQTRQWSQTWNTSEAPQPGMQNPNWEWQTQASLPALETSTAVSAISQAEHSASCRTLACEKGR